MNLKLLKILNVLALFGVITVNALANILPINGVGTGEVSAENSNLFTPAGFTFSIWSLIYLGLLGFSFYQLSGFKKSGSKDITKIIGPFFILNALANISWIFAWHYKLIGLSVIIMLIILTTLIIIDHRIKSSNTSFKNSIFVRFPMGLYLGWICVATVANIAVYLTSISWEDFGVNPQYIAIIMIFIASVVGIFLNYKSAGIFPAIAICWGLFGIYQQDFSILQNNVLLIAIVGILLHMTVIIYNRKNISF